MANYYLGNDGQLISSEKKKKKKGTNYTLQSDGSIKRTTSPTGTLKSTPSWQHGVAVKETGAYDPYASKKKETKEVKSVIDTGIDFTGLTNDGYKSYLDNIKSNTTEEKQVQWLSGQHRNLSALKDENIRKYISVLHAYDNGTGKRYAGEAAKASKALQKLGYSAEDISSMIDTYKREDNAARATKMQQNVAEDTEGVLGSVGHSIGSIGASIVSGVGSMENVGALIKEKMTGEYVPVDTNAGGYLEGSYRDAVRQNVAKQILGEQPSIARKALSGVYQAGMSVVDSTAAAALQVATGIPATAILGASAGVGTSKETFERTGSNSKALATGVASGSIEALTEAVSLGNLWDIYKKSGKAAAKSTLANVLAQIGIEGSEETASELLNRVADDLINADKSQYRQNVKSYMESGLSEEEAEKSASADFWKQTLTAFTMGGLAGGMGAGVATIAGNIAENNLTKNEKKVIEAEVENRISERKKAGEKIDDKTKSRIKSEVTEDLKKGYISIDTIESALGGETYGTYKNLSDEMEEYNSLNKMKAMEMTGEQSDRLAELKEKNKQTSYQSEKTRLKEQLSKEVSEMTLNDRFLQESYSEKSKRSQAFEADIKKYDAKMQTTIQKAVDSGILNNTRRTHEFVDMIAKISADKGVSFDFTNNQRLKESGFAKEGVSVNGYIKDGNVTLNINSTKALNKVVGHEITHVLEGSGLYAELQEAVKAYATTKGEYNSKLEAITKLYEGVEGANVEQELTADLIGEYLFTDDAFVQQLSAQNRNIFRKIYDEIKYLVKTVTSGSKEAKQLEKVKRAFEKAYKDTKNDTETKFSVSEDEKLHSFIEKSLAKEIPDKYRYEITSTISDKLATEIENIVGFSVKGYKNKITPGRIRHIFKRHGSNGEADNSMSNTHDLAKIGYVIENFDSITEGKEQNTEFKNRDDSYAKTIVLQKKINDQYYYVVEAVPDSTAKTLFVVSAYINKKDTIAEAGIAQGLNPDVRNELQSDVSSNDSIPKTKENATENKKFSFAGADALTADNDARINAYWLEQEGKSESDILKETGWFRGADGKWRFEIDDSEAKIYRHGDAELLKKPIYKEYQELSKDLFDGFIDEKGYERLKIITPDAKTIRESKKIKTVSDYMEHPKLYDAYPFLANIPVVQKEMKGTTRGSFSVTEGIEINKEYFGEYREKVLKKILLHELQHAIQHYERFAGGANTETWSNVKIKKNQKKMDEAVKRRKAVFDGGTEEFKNLIRKLNRMQSDQDFGEEYTRVENELFEKYEDRYREYDEANFEARLYMDSDYLSDGEKYLMTAGEIEAREVAQRADWGAEIRKEKMPKRETENGVIFSENLWEPFEYKERQYSLGNDIAPTGKWNVKGSDIVLDDSTSIRKDVAPAQKQGVQQVKTEEQVLLDGPFTMDTDDFKNNTVADSNKLKLDNYQKELKNIRRWAHESYVSFNQDISAKQKQYESKKNKNTQAAQKILSSIERLKTQRDNAQIEFGRRENRLQEKINQIKFGETKEKPFVRKEYHKGIVDSVKTRFAEAGLDFDTVLQKAKDKSTWASVDNTPQRFMEKTLGYKEGQILSDLTVNQTAQNETKAIQWLNSYTDRKNGFLAQISKQYGIKPKSKESAAAQMYGEGFYVNKVGDLVEYGDAELAKDFPDPDVQRNIKGLAKDPRIRKVYDDTLNQINESRRRNGYPEIPRRKDYFLHFHAMEDTFSRLGIPFNPNDIKAKDLPTDINGVTADLKPGQPYFASAQRRKGNRTTYDLLGGLERYLGSAKNQIYHIDDIQTLRALRNYVADTYGQAKGLESLDDLSEEEAAQRIEQVYDSHLSTFAKFLNEQANTLAGKTSLIDRGLEGIIGRKGITFLDTVNKQVGSNMVGMNVSSSLTNLVSVVQGFAKANKFDFTKAFVQTVSNKIGSITGHPIDDFAETNPLCVRRKGSGKFTRTPYEVIKDAGYVFAGAIDDFSTEVITRAKYNELTRKGMDSYTAHIESDKWASRILGDRSYGQQPQLYNSKMLGLVTKFQLEVRNQLDSMYYDTIQETKHSEPEIQNGFAKNAKITAKVGSTFLQLTIGQHLFGQVFEAIFGYNPTLDLIEILIKTFGFDDEEDSEDTVLDNVEQGFLALLEDLPYTSTFTGGRVPIASALPIKELITGTDQYGNKKSRIQTAKEALPYYILPTGYGQIKKSVQGVKMFDDDLPIAGSYTNSGKLRFSVDDNFPTKIQAAISGQYANKNAREYFDEGRAPLSEKKTQELADLDIPISDYWDIQDGLKGKDKFVDKAEYIANLDLPVAKKNILINNQHNRKAKIDLTDYSLFDDFEEFDFAMTKPKEYQIARAAGGYKNYTVHKDAMKDMKTDKDARGKEIRDSKEKKVIDYLNSVNAEYGEKLILFKMKCPSDDTYNYEIIDYLNNRKDITYSQMETILKELGFTVDADGTIRW